MNSCSLEPGGPVADGTIEVREGSEGFDALQAEWPALWEQCPEATEAQTWLWQSLYWKHVVPGRRPVFVTARDAAGALAALAVFCVQRNRRTLLNHFCFLGEHDADYHGILYRDGAPVTLGRRLLGAAARWARTRAAVCEISNVPADSWTARALEPPAGGLEEFGTVREARRSATYRIALPPTMPEYWGLLSKKNREGLRYSLRRLQKDFRVELNVPTTEAELEPALRDLAAVDRKRWEAATRFEGPDGEFIRGLIAGLYRTGVCRLFLLRINGTCAAFNVGFRVRDKISFPYIAGDYAAFGKYSIGLLTNVLAIEHCIQSGIKTYDLTRGAESYKARLGATLAENLHVTIFRSRTAAWLAAFNRRVLAPLARRVSAASST